MRILAIDTATSVTRVAVLDGDRLTAQVEEGGRPHAAALLPAVESVLSDAGLALGEIEGFAVSIGPGSFTGLRIGLATIKAFALGTGRPAAPVPTLAALAWPLRDQAEDLVACLDAQRGELYAAGYRVAGGGLQSRWSEAVLSPAAVVARTPDGATVAGEGLERLTSAPPSLTLVPAAPGAAAVAALGARILARGGGVDPSALVPRYVRRAEAEARRLGSPLEPPDPAGELL